MQLKIMDFFLSLPFELREPIYSYCSQRDLLNLSLCCKSYYESLEAYVWKELHISWSKIGNENIIPGSSGEKIKAYTTAVYFSESSRYSAYSAYESSKRWRLVISNYRRILNYCDADRLIKLDACNLLSDEGLQLACGILKKLENVTLTSLEISNIGWHHLSGLKNLTKLTVNSCSLQNCSIKMISRSQSLKELVLDGNNYLTDDCFDYLGNLLKLEKLSIINTNGLFLSDNFNMYCESLGHFDNLPNLVHLSFKGSLMKNTVISAICTCTFVRKLQTIDVQNCNLLEESGINEIVRFATLHDLKLNVLSGPT